MIGKVQDIQGEKSWDRITRELFKKSYRKNCIFCLRKNIEHKLVLKNTGKQDLGGECKIEAKW